MIKAIIDAAFNLASFLWTILQWPFYALIIFIFIIMFAYLAMHLYLRYYKKIEPIPNDGLHYKFKDKPLYKKLFLAIKQIALDRLTRDPSEFIPRDGRICCFCGRQGSGKTIAMTKKLMEYQTEWPKLKVATNYGYKYEDYQIDHWHDLFDLKNGQQGIQIALDECQQWFNARDYKNLDLSMLQELTTQRKQAKQLLMSTQSFHFLDKSIRCQVAEIHQCITLARTFTIVIVKEPIMTNTGELVKQKFRRMYCFNHDEKLRNAYDTLKVIQTLRKKGFVDRSEQLGIHNASENNVTVNIEQTKKKK